MILQQETACQAEPSLAGAIMRLNAELVRMKSELNAATSEIIRLRRRLLRQPQRGALGAFDLGELRRGVAFYCHPDRAGDAQLMSRLNTLFDLLERCQRTNAEDHDDR